MTGPGRLFRAAPAVDAEPGSGLAVTHRDLPDVTTPAGPTVKAGIKKGAT